MNKSFYCNSCSRYYKSYQSLWNHNKRFHSNYDQNMTKKLVIHDQNMTNFTPPKMKKTDNKICEYCNKELSAYTHLKRHQKICKENNNNNDNNKDELIKSLLNIINKQCKMHPKQLQKINNMIQNNTNNNLNNTNNNLNITINNNGPQIIELGEEKLYEVLTKKEKLDILKLGGGSLEQLIKYVHCNKKYPQFNNIIITNIRNNQAYIYNSEFGKFILSDKNEILEEMITYRFDDIKGFYEECGNNLPEKLKDSLEKFFELQYDNKYVENKCKEFSVLLYNGCDKDLLKIKHNDDELTV